MWARRLLAVWLLVLAAAALLPAGTEAARRRGGGGGGGGRARRRGASASVHDLSDDFDPDEFEGLGEAVPASAEEDEDDDTAFAEPQQDEDEEEEGTEVAAEIGAQGGWDEDGVDDFADGFADDDFSGSSGKDDDEFESFDDEFDVPQKKVTKKQRNNKNGRKTKSPSRKATSNKAKRKSSSSSREASSSKTSSPKATDASPPPPAGPRWGMPEMLGMACVLLYGVVYFAGSAMNERKAGKWIAAFYPIVAQQFHMVGENVMDTSGELEVRALRTLLTKESQNHYRLYASGRESADALIANLELDARQDLFYLLWGLITSTQDMLTIDIPMDSSRMHPFIMAVLPAVEATGIVGSEYCSDIKGLAREVKAAQQYLPPHLVLYSDCNFNEILALLPSKSSSAAKAGAARSSSDSSSMSTMDFLSSPLFHSMHFTDQNARALPSVALNNVVALKNLRFRFKLPRDSNKMSELVPLLQFAIEYYIDRVARFTLSPKAKAKATVIRNKLRSARMHKLGTEEREERLAQRKEEKEKARKEKLEKMNPRDREKFMEKEAARLRKKRMKKSGGKIRVAM